MIMKVAQACLQMDSRNRPTAPELQQALEKIANEL